MKKCICLVALIIIILIPERAFCDEIESKGIEVRLKNRPIRAAPYLSDLGLNSDSLSWGPSVSGVRMAALLIPSNDPHAIELKLSTLVFSISNQSNKRLLIPLMGYFPAIIIYEYKGDIPKNVYMHWQINGIFPQVVDLDPGKMITFAVTHDFNLPFNDQAPLKVTFNFDNWGATNLPDWEHGLVVASQKLIPP